MTVLLQSTIGSKRMARTLPNLFIRRNVAISLAFIMKDLAEHFVM